MTETTTKARERRTTWQLAALAGCGTPDRGDLIGLDYHDESMASRGLTNCPECRGGVWVPGNGGPERKCQRCDGTGSVPHEASAGARFLRHVENAVLELWEGLDDDERDDAVRDISTLDHDGRVHEIADGAPDVYTHTRWQEFVDLAAWQEGDSAEGVDVGSDLTAAAGVALYMIAERLAWALLEELAEAAEEETDPDAPLDVWLRIPDGEDEAEAEANTYRDGDGYRVDWSLTVVGLVTGRSFATLAEAHAWLTAEGFENYTA